VRRPPSNAFVETEEAVCSVSRRWRSRQTPPEPWPGSTAHEAGSV